MLLFLHFILNHFQNEIVSPVAPGNVGTRFTAVYKQCMICDIIQISFVLAFPAVTWPPQRLVSATACSAEGRSGILRSKVNAFAPTALKADLSQHNTGQHLRAYAR